jgi:hypothetical protein
MKNLILCVAFLCATLSNYAQTGTKPTLSVQGILKKANGVAVDDGTYSMTFRLYTAESGGTAIWSENQSNIDVSSGIYSATLGTVEPLNVTFTQLYYLGITIGSTEMKPRVLLTSAPYALSLIGQSNRFPSSGKVLADTVKIVTNLEVGGTIGPKVASTGGVLARSGVPGASGANNNGYGFNGDSDTGLFSTGDGNAVLYSNNTEIARADAGGLVVQGRVTTNGVNISNNNPIYYNGVSDWRLVAQDYAMTDWRASLGWATAPSANISAVTAESPFITPYLSPNNNDIVLKKFIDLAGAGNYTYIKVKFKYYFLDSWDSSDSDRAWAAFATSDSGSKIYIGWQTLASQIHNSGELNPFNVLTNAGNITGTNATWPDSSRDVEMTAAKNGNGFWLFFGAALDGDINDERYGVGMVEVWVK